jgi:hypothetical protein
MMRTRAKYCSFLLLWAGSQYYEKWLLASSRVRPSVHSPVCLSAWNNSAPTEQIVIKFGILVLFQKSFKKIQFH